MVKSRIVLFVAACFLLTGCDRLDFNGIFFESNGDANSRVLQWMKWNDKHGMPIISVPTDEYSIYACADIHAESYPKRFAEFVRRSNADTNSRFYMVLGDMAKTYKELRYYNEIMHLSDDSHIGEDTGFCILGNHDLYFKGGKKWGDVFHTSTYYVTVQTPNYKDLFIFLDSGNGSLGYYQRKWMEGILQNIRPEYRHCVVSLHHNLFRNDHSQQTSGNLLLEETYKLLNTFTENNVNVVLQGHDHWRNITDFDGVRYIVLDDLKDNTQHASYLILEIDETIGHEFIPMGDI